MMKCKIISVFFLVCMCSYMSASEVQNDSRPSELLLASLCIRALEQVSPDERGMHVVQAGGTGKAMPTVTLTGKGEVYITRVALEMSEGLSLKHPFKEAAVNNFVLELAKKNIAEGEKVCIEDRIYERDQFGGVVGRPERA